MDRAGMVLDIRRRIGEDSADFWQDSDIIRELDKAVSILSREEKWPWLYTAGSSTLTLGQSTLTLPADVDFTRAFNIRLVSGSEQPVLPRRVNAVEGFRLETDHYQLTGAPRWFYVSSAAQSVVTAGDETMTYTLKFAPSADKDYDVDYLYLRRPALLSTDNHEPDMPEDLHEAVTALATAKLWQHELVGGDIKAREQLEIYASLVEQARRELYKLQDDEEVVWGRIQDEELRAGHSFVPGLPQNYGPTGWFD